MDNVVNNNNNNNNERAHQQDEEEEPLLQPRIVLLTPEGQQVRSILEKKPEELPQCTINEINKLMNHLAARTSFLTKVRTSIVDDLFVKREQDRQEQQQQQRGLITTIVHNDWHKIEKQYETAFRLFPDVLQETQFGMYPIQRMVSQTKNNNYNLRLVSLVPLAVKLGIKLHQFEPEERGGLLSIRRGEGGWNALEFIPCYKRDKHITNATDECFSVVLKQLRKENLFMKEDIQQYNVGRWLYSRYNDGYFLESRVQYIIDWDPMTLSLPCEPENGNWLPIHWSIITNKDIQAFNFVLKKGIEYFPKKFGFVFCERTQISNGKVFCTTPFHWACKTYGQANVMNEIMIHIKKYRAITPPSKMTATATATTSTTTTTTTEFSSLLMAAVTDESIHIDCLYILLRNDITTALLKLQQHLQQQQQQQQLEKGEGHTVAKITTDNENIGSNNKEITGNSTTTLTSSLSLETVAVTTGAAARTVSSPTTNKNKKNMSSDSASNDNTNKNTDVVSSIATMDTLAAAAAAAVANFNNNNDDDNHNHNVTHHQLSSSSSSSLVNVKKRKQHEM